MTEGILYENPLWHSNKGSKGYGKVKLSLVQHDSTLKDVIIPYIYVPGLNFVEPIKRVPYTPLTRI